MEGLLNKIKPLYFTVASLTAKLQITCQRNNYLKSQNNYMYVLNISRILPVDILVLIAGIATRRIRKAGLL